MSKDFESKFENVQNVINYITAGNATFTFRGTSNRFTYKVKCPHDKDPLTTTILFVNLLTSPDVFQYIGTLKKFGEKWFFTHGRKSKIGINSISVKAFDHVINKLLNNGKMHPDLEIWHSGTCGRCGRELTVPESIESGFGPTCIQIIDKSKM